MGLLLLSAALAGYVFGGWAGAGSLALLAFALGRVISYVLSRVEDGLAETTKLRESLIAEDRFQRPAA